MSILVFNRQKDLKISSREVRSLFRALLALHKVECGEISVYLVSEKKISQLHRDFFQDPSPTDCMTFPLEKNPLSGEVLVCPKVAISYAKESGLDPYQETALYLAHGFLHLLGYDDQSAQERRVMRKKEKSCMDELSALNISLRPKSK